jgi:diacylglycerol O-acyltransferase/trehalose O-mycolyltransferase
MRAMRRTVTSLLLAAGVALTGLLSGLVPAARASAEPTVHQWVTPGTRWIHRDELKPRDLANGKLVTNVVLPPNYGSRKCWPVMYLLHGTAEEPAPAGYSVSDQWLQMDNGALLKLKIPAILVIPGSGDSWWANNWDNGYRAPDWENWVLDYLVPLAQKRLHICSSRSDHSIAGLSMGGYGAMYLASQRPSYFGSAGSFSGDLSPESPNFIASFPSFNTIWGPPDHFYAVGHDPVALVDNLRHTRVFIGVGNGVAVDGENDSTVAVLEEEEFDQESVAFAKKARNAHVSVTFDQHAGTHDSISWIQSLGSMLRWNPFKRIVQRPKSWRFDTVETDGDAWGYRFSFSDREPKEIDEFSSTDGVLSARGAGQVTVTLPDGERVEGQIPFAIGDGLLVEQRYAPTPHLLGGYQKVDKVTVSITQTPATATSPIAFTFHTVEALPADEEYQATLYSISSSILTGVPGAPSPLNCGDTVSTRIHQPAKGAAVSLTLAPPATATTPDTWCGGPAVLAVTEVPNGSPPELGTFLDFTAASLP